MPPTRLWQEKACPVRLEYPADLKDRLRTAAIEGLMALPRVGMGVGGWLLGTRNGNHVKIFESLPILCSHAMGPGFVLTPDEMANANILAGTAEPHIVVGFYCSKTRGFSEVGEADLSLFAALCPVHWQVMIQIKPSTIEECRFALCYRDKNGDFARSAETTLCDEPESAPQSTGPREAGFRRATWICAAAAMVVAAIALLFVR